MTSDCRRNDHTSSIRQIVEARARLLGAIRGFFEKYGFVEVQTPCLSPFADCAPHLESFRTSTELPDGSTVELFLNTSPELYMKRLLAEGLERIFQICPFFRSAEISHRHNPEFIGLEWYEVGLSLEGLMEQTELLVRACHEVLDSAAVVEFGTRPFPVMTLHSACAELGGVELPEDFEPEAVRRAMERHGIHFSDDDEPDDLVNRIVLERVEPRLAGFPAVFVTEYPAYMAALARLHPERPWVAERFELYIAGTEIANGYHELCDAQDQRLRFEQQRQIRARKGLYVPRLDEAFITALEKGVPDCSGCACGLDRLLMVLTGGEHIGDVMPFTLERELSNSR